MIINLTYYHVANDVPEVSPDIAVVIDVLRATTTISWALKNGADSIQVFADLDLLKESAVKWQAEGRLMLGERGGKKIEGFDLGNSPLSVTKKVVDGKRLFMSTTNGARKSRSRRRGTALGFRGRWDLVILHIGLAVARAGELFRAVYSRRVFSWLYMKD